MLNWGDGCRLPTSDRPKEKSETSRALSLTCDSVRLCFIICTSLWLVLIEFEISNGQIDLKTKTYQNNRFHRRAFHGASFARRPGILYSPAIIGS